MVINGNIKSAKSAEKFVCEFCDFKCSKSSDLTRHNSTLKHKMVTNGNIALNFTPEHICGCGATYKHCSGLSRHKKTCSFVNSNENFIENNNGDDNKDLITFLIKENSEIKNLILEMSKNNTTTNINNTNINNSMTNSNNKTFNLQVFLNETCKDAMNIMDFVDSIKISLSDIESIGELGFVNGMSKLIIKHLNALDENMRPVHCNDLKRSSLFVKDANIWAKEDDNNNKLKKAIKSIAHKNICALPEWRKKYPDCIYSESKKSDQYNHIVIEAMGGSGDNDDEKADKIISKIAKTITIDKNNR
jgi:hypothetical protein